MLDIELDKELGVAIVKPLDVLSEDDFAGLSRVIDPFLKEQGNLKGLIIYTEEFPGWESFGSMLQHFRFVKDHQQHISHIALVTDSKIGGVAEKIARHFVSANVRHFAHSQFADAKNWILGAEPG